MAVRARFAQRLVTLPGNVASVVRSGSEEPASFDVERVWQKMVGVYRTGLHPAIALCVRHQGRVVLDRTIGHVDNPPGAAAPGAIATPDTLFSLFSASKILTAMVVHALAEEGLLELDAPLVSYLPELDRHGKDRIRLTHLLNHTAGIADMPQGLDADRFMEDGKVPLESLAELVPTHSPGRRVAYHPMTSWLILAEIVKRVTEQDLRHHLRVRFLEPMGMKHLSYGVGVSDVPRVARHASTGPVPPELMDRIFTRTIGASCTLIERTNEESFLTGLFPSANIIGTANETCRFMQMLLNEGELDGVRVLRAETVRRAVTEVTATQFDGTFLLPMRYGLGTMMGSRFLNAFGQGTQGAFGHLGFSNVVVYADPRRQLAVALLNSGKPMMALGMVRWIRAVDLLASCVPATAA